MASVSAGRIVIADDHPMVRGAIRQTVASLFPTATIEEAGDFGALGKILSGDSDADLVLLDLTMPGVEGFSGLIYLRAQYPAIPVVVVSGHDDPGIIRRAVEFGASGFVPKTVGAEMMGRAIETVLGGGTWTPPDVDLGAPADQETKALVKKMASLTPQQVRVLMMLSQGLLNKQIAYELDVSEATVKAHVSAILTKLDVDSRTQAVIVAGKLAATGTWKSDQALR